MLLCRHLSVNLLYILHPSNVVCKHRFTLKIMIEAGLVNYCQLIDVLLVFMLTLFSQSVSDFLINYTFSIVITYITRLCE